ncbi:low molecular weight phosphatase family protein [Streptomyces sp. NPDC007983]|uniref:arsenate-mycothiol transferase ArsC n=1 Tax=Streptomyces sp. NPDC007983 TaxID=3364800 RepID=UPI0036E72632
MSATARPRRLLAVCLGNHCRSPLAALILAGLGGPAVEVRSAGTRDKWVGHRDVPDPWGKEPEAFADVVRLIEDGAPQHLP